MANLEKVEGIGQVYAKKLQDAGIKNTDMLLEKGSTKKGREDLAKKSDVPAHLLLEWVNHVDLFRVKGVGGQYADLLEAAGVDTVPELARRRADNLVAKMAEINEQKKLVRNLPTENQVADWIEQAKAMPRVITY